MTSKTIFLTGAGKIGKVLAKNLCREHNVILLDSNIEQLDKFKKEINTQSLHIITGDFSNEFSILDIINKIKNEFGSIDVLINTAFPKPKGWGKYFIDPYSLFKQSLLSHLGGHYISTILIAENMKDQIQGGNIINFSSIYGSNVPDFSLYKGTKIKMPISYAIIKAGIEALSKYVASYYGKYKIRCNVIAPGGIYEGQDTRFLLRYENKTPLGRMGVEEDILGLVRYLISDESCYLTGQVIKIDGGWSL